MNRTIATTALIALALAACQRGNNDNIAIDESNTLNAEIETLPPDEAVSDEGNSETTGNDAAPAAASIPAQYQGRWGMVPADCTSTRGDAKGLITIGDKTIRFFESTATLKEQRPAIAEVFSGLFAFTGEGQSWTKVITLTRTGDTLKRAEEGANYSYRRCA
jgi:hypothetical protein